MKFIKMHGLGNDFVMVDCLETSPPAEETLAELSEAICDRNFGVGGDGLILILRDNEAESGAAFRMRMFNPDGSESEMCGNGIRCFGKYLFDKGEVGSEAVAVVTMQGVQRIEILGDERNAETLQIKVDMGTPRLNRSQIPMQGTLHSGSSGTNGSGADTQVIDEPLEVDGATYRITAVSMGNPHCVIFVDDVESVPLKEVGLKIEHHQAFPARTNVHFVQVMGPQKLWMRTWERGAGDTLACGSGACSVAVAAALNGKLPASDRKALVHLPGGDLEIEWAQNNHVYMTGPATTVFDGELDVETLVG